MSKRIKYEVNVGGGCTNGTVLVDDNATDVDIRLAILNDLYEVSYEVVKENNIFNVFLEDDEDDAEQ